MMAAYRDRHANAVAPRFDASALAVLKSHPWPGNVRELRNVLERAFILFSGCEVTGRNVSENLLRLRLPKPRDKEENDALWDAVASFEDDVAPLPDAFARTAPPAPEDFRSWFEHHDEIDLRGFIRDLEVVLIEAALINKEGLVSHAAEALKLRRTTLIEKMKKLMIERPTLD
jgi:sigma-54 specific flagellar transcriptional regulator A